MTPHPQPQYIVSKDDIDELILELEYHRYNNAKIIENRIRSRPHTPAAPADLRDGMEIRFRTKREAWEQGYQDGESAVQHDLNLIKDAAAKAEREQVLNKIIPSLGRAIQTDISDNDYVMIEDLESTIESLRGGDTP